MSFANRNKIKIIFEKTQMHNLNCLFAFIDVPMAKKHDACAK